MDAISLARALASSHWASRDTGSRSHHGPLTDEAESLATTPSSDDAEGSPEEQRSEAVKDRGFRTWDLVTLSTVLGQFEATMLERAGLKVKASAEAASFLHSDAAVAQGNWTRAAAAKMFRERSEAPH